MYDIVLFFLDEFSFFDVAFFDALLVGVDLFLFFLS